MRNLALPVFVFILSFPVFAGGQYSEMQTEHPPCAVYFMNVRLATIPADSIEFALANWAAPKPSFERMHEMEREEWLRRVPSFIRIQFEGKIPRSVIMPMRAFPALGIKIRNYLPTVETYELAADGLKQKSKYASTVKKIAQSDEFDGKRVKVVVWDINDE